MSQLGDPERPVSALISKMWTIIVPTSEDCCEDHQLHCRVLRTETNILSAVYAILLGWPKSLLSFFHKVKDIFFIFTNNFVDLDILSMSATSHVV